MGSRYALRTKLLVAVDVSGSISDPDLEHAYSVINRLFQYGIETIDTLQFDTELAGPVDKFTRKRFQVKIKGRGGTNFGPVLEYIDKHRDYDGLIIVTDGVAGKPQKPSNRHTKVLWLFTSESTFDMSGKSLEHIGRTAFIRPASAAGTRRTDSRRF
jgi:predicted metal-dependent peptidase